MIESSHMSTPSKFNECCKEAKTLARARDKRTSEVLEKAMKFHEKNNIQELCKIAKVKFLMGPSLLDSKMIPRELRLALGRVNMECRRSEKLPDGGVEMSAILSQRLATVAKLCFKLDQTDAACEILAKSQKWTDYGNASLETLNVYFKIAKFLSEEKFQKLRSLLPTMERMIISIPDKQISFGYWICLSELMLKGNPQSAQQYIFYAEEDRRCFDPETTHIEAKEMLEKIQSEYKESVEKNQFKNERWQASKNNTLQLPEGITMMILSYLSPRSLCRVAQTCSHLRKLSSEDVLWEKLIREKMWVNSGPIVIKSGKAKMIYQQELKEEQIYLKECKDLAGGSLFDSLNPPPQEKPKCLLQ